MLLLYDLGWRLFLWTVRITALLGNKQSMAWLEGRRLWRKRIPFERLDRLRPVVWSHNSSLGEFEQARPLLERLREERPDIQIVVSFFSPSGYKVRSNYVGADLVCYLPPDTRRNARDFIKKTRPALVLITKYDLWPHMLRRLRQQRVPVVLFSAHPRPGSLWFRGLASWLYRPLLQGMHRIFVQSEEDVALFARHGYQNVAFAGDTRFDRVQNIVRKYDVDSLVETWLQGDACLVAGSTWPPDEQLLYQMLQHPALTRLKLILVPHSIDKAHLDEISMKCPLPILRYTELQKMPAGQGAPAAIRSRLEGARVMVVDTLGMLSQLYRYGSYCYVGGGFSKGIHNLLEPAAYGKVVLFGPNHSRFLEAAGLLAAGAGHVVQNSEELIETLQQLERDPTGRATAEAAALDYIQRHTGATARIMALVYELLPKAPRFVRQEPKGARRRG